MRRQRAGVREKSYLASLLAVSFLVGLLLGIVLVSTWVEGPPVLQLKEGENYVRSIVITGVEKTTGRGMLATLTVELRSGNGRLLIDVPPYENEDTQISFLDAVKAAEHLTMRNLQLVDIIVSIKNVSEGTTICGPSASAAMAVVTVAAIRAGENEGPNEVRQDAVVSASIDSTGGLEPVGEIMAKCEVVREGGFSLFIVAQRQLGLPSYPGIQVEKVSNLHELLVLMLT